MLYVYNSLTRKKEKFTEITPGQVKMYACGITVYDYFHIGNARMMIVFDTIVRYLRASGYQVTYVRNITDIDDKIIERAHANGEDASALAQRFTTAMHEDLDQLGVLRPDLEPRATETIAEMQTIIGTLIDKKLAYVADSGDVLYDVSEFPTYGALSNANIDDLRAGSRVEVDAGKHDPLDFVLWKAAKPGEPSWPSPWGPGRPGWHIECSAMAALHLGTHFDIHGGGMDLKFPHHENEIAQSEGAHGCTFVNYWLHNGFVQVDEEKMSKSLGNFFTTREVLKQHHPEVIRFFILGSHYRQPLNYSETSLDSARASLARLYTALREAATDNGAGAGAAIDEQYQQRFFTAMDDDFNTPEALAVLFELARELNRASHADSNSTRAKQLAATLHQLGGHLGLLQQDPVHFLQYQSDATRAEVAYTDETSGNGLSAERIDALIAERLAARSAKDWTEADRIRDLLTAGNIVLEDGPDGTIWRRG